MVVEDDTDREALVLFSYIQFCSVKLSYVQLHSVMFSYIMFYSITFSSIQLHADQFSSVQLNQLTTQLEALKLSELMEDAYL